MIFKYLLLCLGGAIIGDFSLAGAFSLFQSNDKFVKSKGCVQLRLSDFDHQEFSFMYDDHISAGTIFKECVLVPELESNRVEIFLDDAIPPDFLDDALTGLYHHGYSLSEVADSISFYGDRHSTLEANLIILEDFEEDD